MKLLPSVFAVAFLMAECAAMAGSKEIKSVTEAEDPALLNYFRVDASYVGSSDFEGGDSRFGDQDASNLYLRYTRRIEFRDPWYFKMGLEYDRFDFGASGAPVPNHLQSASVVLGFEYVRYNETGLLFETKPGVFFENEIDSGAFDAPTALALAYPVFGGDRFYLIGGVSVAILREYPVIPVIGAVWRINSQWTLKAYLPEPKLVYKPRDEFRFWVGGELLGGGYKTDDRDNWRPRKINGGVVSYTDYRAGGGVAWKPCPWGRLEVSGGWSFERKFDYHRADRDYSVEGAPYVKVAVIAEF